MTNYMNQTSNWLWSNDTNLPSSAWWAGSPAVRAAAVPQAVGVAGVVGVGCPGAPGEPAGRLTSAHPAGVPSAAAADFAVVTESENMKISRMHRLKSKSSVTFGLLKKFLPL